MMHQALHICATWGKKVRTNINKKWDNLMILLNYKLLIYDIKNGDFIEKVLW